VRTEKGRELESDDRGGHESKKENEQRKKCPKEAVRIKRDGVVDGRNAKKADSKQQNSPHIPADPMAEEPKRN